LTKNPLAKELLFNTQNQPITVNYAFDKRLNPAETWVGIVLRNLPPDVPTETMRKNLLGSRTVVLKLSQLTPLWLLRDKIVL
jgi:hypothetical protein